LRRAVVEVQFTDQPKHKRRWWFLNDEDPDKKAHAERFGIFVGLWAPTLLILSNRFDRFADKARAMYYGEVESRPIWGDTPLDEARTLQGEGVPAAPLPAPFAPPRPKPLKDVN